MKFVEQVINALIETRARSATKFISPKEIVRASRRRVRGRITGRGNIDIVLTIGRPNYAEREFIKACTKAGEPFPVKKIRLRQIAKA